MPQHVRDLLLDVATNNETSFFRDPGTFAALETFLVPSVRTTRARTRPLHIWSAAASSGQEAYSIVMTLEAIRARDPTMPDYRLVATDISDRILARARAGAYSHLEVQRGLPARQLIQSFDKDGDGRGWTIKKPIRDRVEFRKLNLLGAWTGLPEFDLVFLRNVLIYQSPASKERIVQRTFDHMASGGYLVLGSSESLLGVTHGFQMENIAGVHLYRKP